MVLSLELRVDLILENLKESDLQQVIELSVTCFEDLSDPEDCTREYATWEFARAFSDEFIKPMIFVAKSNNKILAMSLVYKHACTPFNFSLSWVCTSPEHRGQNIATKLMIFTEEQVLKNCNGRESAISFIASQKVQPFYEKLGYIVGTPIHNKRNWMVKVLNSSVVCEANHV